VSTAAEPFEERLHPGPHRDRTVVHEDELLRHPVYARVLHWTVAVLFILALLSGFALYTPWLFRWLTPIFGGGAMTRLLHPWFSLGFVVLFGLQFWNWRRLMTWTDDDRRWMRRLRKYITNEETSEPEYVGFFNAGQKLYFWAIAGSAIIFLVSGIFMWFPATFGRLIAAIGYVVHDISAVVMLVGFTVHVYEASVVAPGTFRSMIRGTVQKRWAKTHHPAWYRRETGRKSG
jgi:formate dehydrogenase subunit gamma